MALVAIAVAAAPPALARDPQLTVIAPSAKLYTIRVPYSDLDLKDGSAVAVLQARVDAASLAVCEPTRFEALLDMVERSNCITNARIDARPQIASAIARAGSGQIAALGAAIRVSAAL